MAGHVDKLDGKITDEYWIEITTDWGAEKEKLSAELACHLEADDAYLDTGVRILELARRAYGLYSKQNAAEKRRLLGLLLSNCTFTDGMIHPTYNQPFDILTVMAAEAAKQRLSQTSETTVLQVWGG